MIINNAGLDHFEKFEKLETQHLKDLIAVNCTAPVLIVRNFVDKLRARPKKGGIINVSSGAMVQYMAYYTTYSGTKAHVDMFTRSLADEYPELDILSLKPFDVSTKMIGYRQTDIMTISPEKCVHGTLNDLGYQDDTYGHWMHKIQGGIVSWAPRWFFKLLYLNFFIHDFFKERDDMRKKEAEAQNKKKND